MTTMVAFPFISETNGLWYTINTTATNEVELRNAINAVPDNEACTIGIANNITLEKPLEIPEGKTIALTGGWGSLIGADEYVFSLCSRICTNVCM